MSGKQLRLRVRLQLTATALSTLLLGLGAWAAPAYFSHAMRLEAENHAHTQLTQLKGHIEAPLAFSDQETVLLELQKLGVDALSYAEVQANGTMMVRIDTKAEAPKGPPFIIDKPYIWQEGNTIHGALRFKSALDEAVTLRVGFAMGRLVEAEENLQRSAMAASLLLASGLWLLLYLLSVRMLRPIEQTTRLADAIAGGRLASVTVPELDTLPTDGDELARLERAFTMMVYELREKRTALEQSREGLEAQVAKQTEKLSKALEQAQAASRAKSRFLANMSHEIRTPMNGVLGMARVLKGTPMNSEQREMVAIIEDTGRTLMSLLNQILDMSRVESGRLVLEDLLYDVRPAFRDVVSLFRVSAQTHQIDLTLDIAERVPIGLKGDILRLRQILGNLISNSLKFTEQGQVHVSVDYVGGVLQVSVRDTGPGIRPERQSAIFEDFTQANTSTSRTHGGTGLGLHICQQLVMLMDGQIGVHSELGKGSTFWFSVPQPLGLLASVSHPAAELTVSINNGIRVLVVDDNPINLKVACYMLQNFGVDIVTAGDGQEAVNTAQGSSFHLILMDCQMPGIDGFEATRRIRASGNNTPIIALTASAFAEDRSACLEAGMNEMLTKPVMPEDLAGVLRRYAL